LLTRAQYVEKARAGASESEHLQLILNPKVAASNHRAGRSSGFVIGVVDRAGISAAAAPSGKVLTPTHLFSQMHKSYV